MIGRLTGSITTEDTDGLLVVDVGGVGYEVLAPLGTLGRAQADASGARTLFIHTHVREDAFLLFGFANEADRSAFRALIGVSNIGPKTAIAVLSALSSAELAEAVTSKNVARLTAISGIGKKTAERLVLELKDKLQAPRAPIGKTPERIAPAPTGQEDVLLGALTRMGYKSLEAERAIAGLPTLEAPLPELLKQALVILAR